MKKKLLIGLIIVILLIPCCYFLYETFTKEEVAVNEPEIEETFTGKLKNKFSNHKLKVDASLNIQPLMDHFIEYFGNEDMASNLKLSYSNTYPAYLKLINGEVDLIIATYPTEKELKYAKEKNIDLEINKIVNEPFVFYTHKNNPVNSIKLNDIVNIYAGKISNWQEIGGDDSQIIAYQKPATSPSQVGMTSLVMKDVSLMEPRTKKMINDEGITSIVADYDNNLNALGYSYNYYEKVMYKGKDVKLLGIDGVLPSYKNVQSGTYSLITPYYVVTRKYSIGDIKSFKEALLSNEGAMIAKEAGYVPVEEK